MKESLSIAKIFRLPLDKTPGGLHSRSSSVDMSALAMSMIKDPVQYAKGMFQNLES